MATQADFDRAMEEHGLAGQTERGLRSVDTAKSLSWIDDVVNFGDGYGMLFATNTRGIKGAWYGKMAIINEIVAIKEA